MSRSVCSPERKIACSCGPFSRWEASMAVIALLGTLAAGEAVAGKKLQPAATRTFTKPISPPIWPEVKRQAPHVVAAEIDRLIEARLAKEKIPASPIAEDAEFLRRVHLDLIGRIPTPDRAASFLDDKSADKRAKLIDELLASPEYGKHFGNVWHDRIVPRTPINGRINPEALRAAFRDAFNANLPWSEVAARVVLCQGGTKETNFLTFYQVNGDMGGNPMANVVARSFARLFLGVRMECAECHDDPFKNWRQEEYWGIAAFFGRVTRGQGDRERIDIAEGTGYKPPKGNNFRLAVNANGALAVHQEAWKKAGKLMKPAVLGGKPLDFGAGQPLLPSFTSWLTAPDNPYLARAAVNHFWDHLFARGLFNPIDDYAEGVEPSHPVVLRLLVEEFTRSRHDVKHLFRCLCNTRTYQRSSLPVPGNEKLEDPLFCRMPLKVMTAEMLLDSLGVAFDNPELFPRSAPVGKKKSKRPLVFTRRNFIDLFNTNDVEGTATDYTHGIPQVLHLMNVPLYNAGGNTVAKLTKSYPDTKTAIERLYLATLSRSPTTTELKRKLDLVARHKTPADGLNGVLWILINQSEFVLNH